MSEESEPPPPEQASPAEETAAPASGRYAIEGTIGSGGMGQVFRAWDQNLGRHVAIKRIGDGAGVDEAIRREAGILAALHHPNIVTIFDFSADEHGPFAVMELVDGRDLDSTAKSHPLTVPAFLELVNQICRGLSSAHAAGLLHLDLKPGNIMLQFHQDGSFTSKILDFGLARAHEESADPSTDDIYASPYTVPPEQLTRQPLDVRSDIYSLGCVFYFALSGRNAFEAPTVADILQRHMDGTTTPLHLIAPKVPKAMSEVIARMIHVDPDQRPQSVEQARAELHRATRAPAPAAARVAPGVYRPSVPGQSGGSYAPARTAPRRSPAAAGGGQGWLIALLVLAAAGGGWWLVGQNRPGSSGGNTPSASPDAEVVAPAISISTLDPTDAAAFASHNGEVVVVEGTVVSVVESSLFRAMILKLKGVPVNGAVLSVSQSLMDPGRLRELMGKRVRATGKCVSAVGVNRVVVGSAADIGEIGH